MKGTDVLVNIDGGAERDLDPAATADPDRARSAVDRHSLLASVDPVVHRRSADLLDRLYHSDLVVVPRNVDRTTDREAAVSPSAGTAVILNKLVMHACHRLAIF